MPQLSIVPNNKIATIITRNRKAELGQFMTPPRVAKFMALLFPPSSLPACRLLDAGAGTGALTCAFLDRCTDGDFNFGSLDITAFEIDDILRITLEKRLASYSTAQANIIGGDYIVLATSKTEPRNDGYTHIILNPPYKKINSKSAHRLALRRVGIETVNLYSAFLALAVAEAAPNGQIVAIIPRSFCNGPYYRPFRDFILERTAIRHMHLFESRSKAFKEDDVLQENVIIRLERGGQQGPVTISTSQDDTFTDLTTHKYPFEQIVFPDDAERFIHIPKSPEKNTIELSSVFGYTLNDLGVKISTGPVVDFRVKEYLHSMPGPNTVPLLYPAHIAGSGITWPIKGLKKPNAIEHNANTERWLYPSGFYCIVRRFSSKEEKRRIVASVVDPSIFGDVPMLGFENHLNLFHENKQSLPPALAHGLATFLNTTAFDESFRRFNGHTQVNATDLKLMKYPSRDALIKLGKWAMRQKELTQSMIDNRLETLTK